MHLSQTQKEFLTVLDDGGATGLLFYQISARMTHGLKQPTIDKVLQSGFAERLPGGLRGSYRITEAGRSALSN